MHLIHHMGLVAWTSAAGGLATVLGAPRSRAAAAIREHFHACLLDAADIRATRERYTG